MYDFIIWKESEITASEKSKQLKCLKIENFIQGTNAREVNCGRV